MRAKIQIRGNKVGVSLRGGNFIPLLTIDKTTGNIYRDVTEKDFFRKYNGYAMHETILNFLKREYKPSTKFIIRERETNKKYISTLSDWENEGKWISSEKKVVKTGLSGSQKLLSIDKMKTPSDLKIREVNEPNWEEMRKEVIAKRNNTKSIIGGTPMFSMYSSMATLPREEAFIASTVSEMTAFEMPPCETCIAHEREKRMSFIGTTTDTATTTDEEGGRKGGLIRV